MNLSPASETICNLSGAWGAMDGNSMVAFSMPPVVGGREPYGAHHEHHLRALVQANGDRPANSRGPVRGHDVACSLAPPARLSEGGTRVCEWFGPARCIFPV